MIRATLPNISMVGPPLLQAQLYFFDVKIPARAGGGRESLTRINGRSGCRLGWAGLNPLVPPP